MLLEVVGNGLAEVERAGAATVLRVASLQTGDRCVNHFAGCTESRLPDGEARDLRSGRLQVRSESNPEAIEA
jgi:hypothetical protein